MKKKTTERLTTTLQILEHIAKHRYCKDINCVVKKRDGLNTIDCPLREIGICSNNIIQIDEILEEHKEQLAKLKYLEGL